MPTASAVRRWRAPGRPGWRASARTRRSAAACAHGGVDALAPRESAAPRAAGEATARCAPADAAPSVKTATASRTVATTNASSIQRYAPTSYSPSANAKPAARASVADPRVRARATPTRRSAPRPGCRRDVSKIRAASSHGGRQHLPRRVADEVRPRQPAEPLVDGTRLKQPLPAPRHRQHRHRHDRHRRRQPVVRPGEDVDRLVDVDLPDDVGEARPGYEQRRGDAHAAPLRRFAPREPRMHAAHGVDRVGDVVVEWAGESGSDSTSSPARSATGSGCWSG